MTDVFSVAKRSVVMSRIRGKGNKSTELLLAAAFRKAGIRGWRRHVLLKLTLESKRGSENNLKPELLRVKPDFVFSKERIAVFVDGCFWHQCPFHSTIPENNRRFWEEKLARNIERDRAANKALKAAGWFVLRIWEHNLSNTRTAANHLERQLDLLRDRLRRTVGASTRPKP